MTACFPVSSVHAYSDFLRPQRRPQAKYLLSYSQARGKASSSSKDETVDRILVEAGHVLSLAPVLGKHGRDKKKRRKEHI
jgi:hypothetical protein